MFKCLLSEDCKALCKAEHKKNPDKDIFELNLKREFHERTSSVSFYNLIIEDQVGTTNIIVEVVVDV